MKAPDPSILSLVQAALDEDVGPGDITSLGALEPEIVKGVIAAKSNGVLSGLQPAVLTFQKVDSANKLTCRLEDGDSFAAGDTIVELEGLNRTLLTAERTALNFLAHLSGVATLTRRFVDAVVGTNCTILDTRKTTPGFRLLEKAAVRHGGGANHRIGLYDMVLIKDNHIAAAGSVSAAVEGMRSWLASSEYRLQFDRPADEIEIEVEVKNTEELTAAIKSGVKRLLLDNQSIESLLKMVELARKLDGEIKLEASGNVNLDTVAAIAATGVDYVSIGALTHSAPACDFSMRLLS